MNMQNFLSQSNNALNDMKEALALEIFRSLIEGE